MSFILEPIDHNRVSGVWNTKTESYVYTGEQYNKMSSFLAKSHDDKVVVPGYIIRDLKSAIKLRTKTTQWYQESGVSDPDSDIRHMHFVTKVLEEILCDLQAMQARRENLRAYQCTATMGNNADYAASNPYQALDMDEDRDLAADTPSDEDVFVPAQTQILYKMQEEMQEKSEDGKPDATSDPRTAWGPIGPGDEAWPVYLPPQAMDPHERRPGGPGLDLIDSYRAHQQLGCLLFDFMHLDRCCHLMPDRLYGPTLISPLHAEVAKIWSGPRVITIGAWLATGVMLRTQTNVEKSVPGFKSTNEAIEGSICRSAYACIILKMVRNDNASNPLPPIMTHPDALRKLMWLDTEVLERNSVGFPSPATMKQECEANFGAVARYTCCNRKAITHRRIRRYKESMQKSAAVGDPERSGPMSDTHGGAPEAPHRPVLPPAPEADAIPQMDRNPVANKSACPPIQRPPSLRPVA
ncbi:hypothetical protein PG985_009744 [Apiospora marii]|uniref:uncharacterized protein n=1 Tax=Apiospora marii TaxID=335849 RepID=UPI00312F620C